ncbi:hypothetical protein Rs2_39926 [Raphanus sativus]|nr:hypothetical protein Rs2_39926 [Raphanus sativus]
MRSSPASGGASARVSTPEGHLLSCSSSFAICYSSSLRLPDMLVDLRWGYDRVRSQAQGFQIRFRFSFWWFHGEVLKRLGLVFWVSPASECSGAIRPLSSELWCFFRPETGSGQMYAGGDGALFPALARVNDRVVCSRASNGEAVLGSHSRPRCLHLIKVASEDHLSFFSSRGGVPDLPFRY